MGLNSGHQVWRQASLLTESIHWTEVDSYSVMDHFFFNVKRYLIIRIYHNRFIYNRFLCSFVKEQFSYLQFDPLCTKHE